MYNVTTSCYLLDGLWLKRYAVYKKITRSMLVSSKYVNNVHDYFILTYF